MSGENKTADLWDLEGRPTSLTPTRFWCHVCRDERPNQEIGRLRVLLNAWLMSGAMEGADLDKLVSDTEEAIRG